jgi:acylphosphatase
MKTMRIIVSGRVQGVYFRAYTQKLAIKHGIKGYVKNMKDGSVEIVAGANQQTLEKFINGCKKGPMMAKVDGITVSEYTSTIGFDQFDIF